MDDNLIKTIEEADVVLSAPLTHYNDPQPLYDLIDVAQRALSDQIDNPFAMRTRIWRALALSSVDSVARIHYGPHMHQQKMCIGHLLSLAALRLSLKACNAEERTASQIGCPFLEVAPAISLSDYTVTNVVAALQVLREETTRCCFSMALVAYCEALEARCAALIFYTWPEQVHDLVKMRRDAEGGGFRCCKEFVHIVWCSLLGIYRRFLHACAIIPPTPDVAPISDSEHEGYEKLRQWFLARAKAMITDEPSRMLQFVYPASQLRPGDVELTRLKCRGIMPTTIGVMQATLEPGRMAAIISEKELPLGTILQRDLDSVEAGKPEPMQVGLCMCELLDVLTRDVGAAAFCKAFAFHEQLLAQNPDYIYRLCIDRPLMVQVFNHWQFAYRGQLYMLNSFLRSLYMWLDVCWKTDYGDLLRVVQQDGTVYRDLIDLLQLQRRQL